MNLIITINGWPIAQVKRNETSLEACNCPKRELYGNFDSIGVRVDRTILRAFAYLESTKAGKLLTEQEALDTLPIREIVKGRDPGEYPDKRNTNGLKFFLK